MIKVIVLLFLIPLNTYSQWSQSSEFPLVTKSYDMFRINQETYWFAGEKGLLFKTTNSGASFSHYKTSIANNINAIHFVNSLFGIAAADDGYVLLTTNGGFSWSHNQLFPGVNLRRLCFVSSTTGFMIGGQGILYKTTNAGALWVGKSLPPDFTATGISFLNEQIGIMTSGSVLLRTSDGGESWQTVNLAAGVTAKSVYMQKPGTAYFGGIYGTIHKSVDNGITWSLHFQQSNAGTINDISFGDDNNGLFIIWPSTSLSTTDGGNSFTFIHYPWNISGLQRAYLYGQSTQFLITSFRNTYKSTNAGLIWDNIILRYPIELNAVDAANNNFYLVGASGRMFSYKPNSSLGVFDQYTSNRLNAVSFNGCDYGFVVGDRGTLLKGYTYIVPSWSNINSGTTQNLLAVSRCKEDYKSVVAVGDSGTIIWSLNGYNGWEPRQSGTRAALNGVAVLSPQTAIIVGDSGIVLRTTDYGSTWVRMSLGIINKLNYINAFESFVLIAGKNGVCYRSIDSGKTWVTNNLPATSDLTAFSLLNRYTARALTKNGELYVTSNAGMSWRYEYKLQSESLSSMAFLGSTTAIATTADGYVYTQIAALPVELTQFSASPLGNSIGLNWSTASETNNHGFEIQKSIDNHTWNTIGFIRGAGSSTEQNNYFFTDNFPDPGINYYRLYQVDYDGTGYYSETASFNYVSGYLLSDNYPNPFNPETKITYRLPEAGRAIIQIFDVLGNIVAVPLDEKKEPGTYILTFNAAALSSGIYYYRITAGQFSQTKKMVVIK